MLPTIADSTLTLRTLDSTAIQRLLSPDQLETSRGFLTVCFLLALLTEPALLTATPHALLHAGVQQPFYTLIVEPTSTDALRRNRASC